MPDSKLEIFGITGPIGSGKTTLAGILTEYGAVNLEVDYVGHEILKCHEIQHQLADVFGNSIFAPNGTIDRRRLGKLAFASPQATASLNAITHPAIIKKVEEMLDDERIKETPLVLLNAALLYTMNLDRFCRKILYVRASPQLRLKRLVATRGLPMELAEARLSAQDKEPTNDDRVIFCDNDKSVEELRSWVELDLVPLLPESIRNRNGGGKWIFLQQRPNF